MSSKDAVKAREDAKIRPVPEKPKKAKSKPVEYRDVASSIDVLVPSGDE